MKTFQLDGQRTNQHYCFWNLPFLPRLALARKRLGRVLSERLRQLRRSLLHREQFRKMLKNLLFIIGGIFTSFQLLSLSSIFQGGSFSLASLVKALIAADGLAIGITVICYCVMLYDKGKGNR